MKNIYSIGRFRFDSYTEYKKGVEDVKKIKSISEELDIKEPGVALRLYTLIREDKIKFYSVIGEDYLLYLSDLVADNYKDISDGSEVYLAKLGGGRSPRKIAGILCILAAILCFAYFFGSEYISQKKAREMKELQNRKEIKTEVESVPDKMQEENIKKEETIEKELEPAEEMLPELVELYEENQDLIGWITIPETVIDYPVLQSKDSKDFYLKHNFEKKEDSHGSIFLDSRNNVSQRDQNLIIYGHNMKDGTMFGGLGQYIDETKNYWQEHKKIQFYTLYERQEYDIIAVCLAEVANQTDEVFRYYDFINAQDELEFGEFKENITQMNILDDELEVSLEDELITVSTCNSYVEDGRTFLVAKRIK